LFHTPKDTDKLKSGTVKYLKFKIVTYKTGAALFTPEEV
jgi:hypothetical protein